MSPDPTFSDMEQENEDVIAMDLTIKQEPLNLALNIKKEVEKVEDFHENRLLGADLELSMKKSEADSSYVGSPEVLERPYLTSIISSDRGDASFGKCGEDKKHLDQTMIKPNKQNTKLALKTAIKEISDIAGRINLPETIVDEAIHLFKRVYYQPGIKFKRHKTIAATCLFIACRQQGVPHTFKEIEEVSSISKYDMGKMIQLVRKRFKTSLDHMTKDDYMVRFCSKLGLSDMERKTATHIARKADDLGILVGKHPSSLAGAAIYMVTQVSENKRTPQQICEITGISVSTIRTKYKKLYPHAVTLFPQNFKFATPIDQLSIS